MQHLAELGLKALFLPLVKHSFIIVPRGKGSDSGQQDSL